MILVNDGNRKGVGFAFKRGSHAIAIDGIFTGSVGIDFAVGISVLCPHCEFRCGQDPPCVCRFDVEGGDSSVLPNGTPILKWLRIRDSDSSGIGAGVAATSCIHWRKHNEGAAAN